MIDDPSKSFSTDPVVPNEMFELRVAGRLDQQHSAWFEDMTLEVDDSLSPPQTIIRGPIRDQSALYGLISRIRDLGLKLLSVRQVEQKEES